MFGLLSPVLVPRMNFLSVCCNQRNIPRKKLFKRRSGEMTAETSECATRASLDAKGKKMHKKEKGEQEEIISTERRSITREVEI
jgi:hypothetical protein